MPKGEPDDFADLIGCLNGRGVEYVIVGAHAVAFHGYVRGTKDFDILLRQTPENAPRVVEALRDFGFGSLGLTHADFDAEKVVQLGHAPNRVDLLGALTGVETETVWRTRVRGSYAGKPAAYITLEALLRNKRALDRTQDRLDVEKLERQAHLKRSKKRRR